METIEQYAKSYVGKQIKNVADLDNGFSKNDPIFTDIGVDKDGKEYEYQYIMVNDDKYRIPTSVIVSIKALLEKRPDLDKFDVLKSGTGTDTRYQVIPKTQ